MPKKAAKKLARGKSRVIPVTTAPDENFDELIGGEKETKEPEVVTKAAKAIFEKCFEGNTRTGQLRAGQPETTIPVCPITPDNTMGDKDPRVVAWWQENHPALAEKKYAGRVVNG